MKNKMKFLINMSLSKKIKNKWFVIANIFLALLIVGIANIDHIVTFFGGDFNKPTKIYVIDKIDGFDIFKMNIEEGFKIVDSKYELINTKDKKDDIILNLKNNKEEENSILLILDDDKKDIIKASIISNGFIDTLKMNLITSSLKNLKTNLAIEKYNINSEELEILNSPVNVDRILLDETKDSKEENTKMIMNSVFPVLILPFFMLVLFLVQMIGAEVNDEKTTRGMEIIIGNVSPTVHFFSKCISGNLFILIQAILLISYGLLGFISRSFFPDVNGINGVFIKANGIVNNLFSPQFINSLRYLIPLILLLMFVTFIGYSLLAAILASATTNTEDFQQLQTPIILISLIGYYLAIMAGAFKGSTIIHALGYFPFISAILGPSLLVIGEFTVFDVIISIIIMVIIIYLLIKYGLRIYKVGILNYSSEKLWRKMFNSLKQKNGV